MELHRKQTERGPGAIYRQEIMQDVLLFTSQGIASFYDKLFSSIEFVLPRATTGRKGFPKEAMLCAFIVMKCEGFNRMTDLLDFLQCNLLIAHYCGFDITRPLPSYWTFDRFARRLENGKLKEIMAAQIRKLYELGPLDAAFIGLDSTPVAASTAQNNPKTFGKSKFDPENQPRNDPDCALGVHTASNRGVASDSQNRTPAVGPQADSGSPFGSPTFATRKTTPSPTGMMSSMW